MTAVQQRAMMQGVSGPRSNDASEPVCAELLGEALHDGTKQAHAHINAALIDLDIALVQVILLAGTGPAPQASHGSWHLLKVPGEILSTAGLRGLDDSVRVNGLNCLH